MRVYEYGARPPCLNGDLVQMQLRLAHGYQLGLTMIEIKRRKAVDHLYQHACPDEYKAFIDASTAVKVACENIGKVRSRHGGDLLEPDKEMEISDRDDMKAARAEIERLRGDELVVRQIWKDARKKKTPGLKKRLAMCDRGAKARAKFAYNFAGKFGLAWGTRLRVAEFVERASEMSAKIGAMPHLPRFDGSGLIAVQLQGAWEKATDVTQRRTRNAVKVNGAWRDADLVPGADRSTAERQEFVEMNDADALAATDTRFKIEVLDRQAFRERLGWGAPEKNGVPFPKPKEGSKRSQKIHAIVWLRIGSEGRDPVWAAWPIVLHRPLPPGASIKWAQAHAKKIGSRTEWRVQITVDDSVPALKTVKKTLAVNFGWRTCLDDGLRVAHAVGSDGHKEEIRVPPKYVSGVAHVDSLRSIRDKLFETVQKTLREWLTENDHPDWLSEKTKYVDRWESQKKLVFLIALWEKARFDGDDVFFKGLQAWLKKDKHLRFWECDERIKLLRGRQDFYRTISARWAHSYDRIIVTDMDLRDFAEAPAPEEAASTKGKRQRVAQRLAAPSELRGALKNACSTRGTTFDEIKAINYTQICNACACVVNFDAKPEIAHTCHLCGAVWDQDENHCRNILAAALREDTDPTRKIATKKDNSNRWKKRKAVEVTTETIASVPQKTAKAS